MTGTDRHGGNVHAASRELGLPLAKILDFSASINPLGPSRHVLRVIRQTIPQLIHYPDPECTVLRTALSRRYRLPADLFVIGNGSTELIDLVPRLLPRLTADDSGRVVIIGPTFSEYARAIARHGGSAIELHADRKSAYEPPIREAIREVARTPLAAIVLCNPNSPTGRLVPAATMRELLDAASRRNVWVILDETFAEYADAGSVIRDVVRRPRLVVLRSFTKFYALPGLRVGYAVAPHDVAARLRSLLPPWSVNTLAQGAAVAALSDAQYAARSRRFMKRERARLTDRLEAVPGLKVYRSRANFLLLEVPGFASDTVAVLRRHGVLVRDCSGVPGLTQSTIRVAVRSRAENNRLLRLLRSVLSHGSDHGDANLPSRRSEYAHR
jgi:threonine-phosphate decarboxylase